MDRTEFIDRLQRALAGGVNSSRVAENVQYYREYIDVEIRKGRSEQEVLESLGDPRLLAKSIIEANKRAGISEGTNRTYDEETGEDRYGELKKAAREKIVRVPGWLIALIAVVIFLLIIGLAFSIISLLAPIIIPVLIVILAVNYFKGRK
ncbi:MAG: DUF1700 domain-containing protein [Lachnospiraceae bacterium]|nr:DUF1700 domain-containing protein [Lachnospiraceae bacterium]